MTTTDHLADEQRLRPRFAVLSAVAGALLIAAAIVQLAGPHTSINELTIDLIIAHKRYPLDVIGSVVNAFGLISFALSVGFLWVCTQARRNGMSASSRISTLVGGGLAAVSGIVYAVVIAAKADKFVTTGTQTYEEAHHLTNGPGLLALPLLGQAAALMLAIGVFFVALNAMRVGLLTRFMGYLGLFVGALVIFPIGSPVPVVQGFWLFALGVLFAGRWPSGTPAAWATGRAEAWPSSQELREQRAGKGAATAKPARTRPARGAAAAEPVPEAPVAQTRANTPKRKRKKRR